MNSTSPASSPQRSPETPDETILFGNQDVEFAFISEYLPIVLRGWKTILALGIVGAAVGFAYFLSAPVMYQASSRIQIERRFTNLPGAGLFAQSWWNPEFYPTQRELLTGRGLAERLTKDEKLWQDPFFAPAVSEESFLPEGQVTPEDDNTVVAGIAARVRSGLSVRQIPDTQLFELTYRSTDPHIAMRLANAYADTFIEMRKSTSQNDARATSENLADEIKTLQTEIAALEQDRIDYSQSADIVAPDDQTNVTLQRLTAANEALLAAQSRRITAQAEYNELRNRPSEDVAESSSLALAQRGELIRLQGEYDAKLETYQPSFPSMVELKDRIDEAERQLAQLIGEESRTAVREAQLRYQQALQTERSLEREYEAMEDETRRYQSVSTRYQTLTSDIAAKRETLERLQSARSQANLGASTANTTIVTRTEQAHLPKAPYSPQMRRFVPVGGVLGLVAGIALILLLDFLDRSIKTPEEAERRLDQPVLGVIPDVERRTDRVRKSRRDAAAEEVADLAPFRNPRSSFAEAYRALRTATLLTRADEPKTLVVTSAGASEGKTVTSVNLAIVLAQLGRRTLIIDSDLRKPRVHEAIGLSNRQGFVNSLVQHVPLRDTIQETEIPNLFALTAGSVPPNPSELLSSDRFADLLAEVNEVFDMVVIDTPPVMAVSDAILVGRHADGCLLCVRANRQPREQVRRALHDLERSSVPVIGLVLNGHRARSGGYGYGYGSGYGYGYGYGHESPDRSAEVSDVA